MHADPVVRVGWGGPTSRAQRVGMGIGMGISVDTSRELRRPSDLADLVHAIEHALDSDETGWIEWKTELDVSSASGAFKVARAILSFANRMPDAAATTCGGLAYFVLGIEPGNVVGTPEIDGADLEQYLLKYLGADGPVWAPSYVKVAGDKMVLVITVEPPRWGDPIHALRKAYDRSEDGTIFVRSQARSRPANSAEIRLLGDRLVRGSADPDLDGLDVGFKLGEPGEVVVIDPLPENVDAWLEARGQVITQWQQRKVDNSGKSGSIWRPRLNTSGIAEHLEHCRLVLFDAQRKYVAGQGWSRVTVSVTNRTRVVLEDVELTLEVPGEWSAYSDDDPVVRALSGLPDVPLVIQPALSNSLYAGSGISPVMLPRVRMPALGDPTIEVDRTSVTLQLGKVRPEKPRDASPFTLVLHGAPETQGTLAVGWSITSTSRVGVLRGEIYLPVQAGRVVWLMPDRGVPGDAG